MRKTGTRNNNLKMKRRRWIKKTVNPQCITVVVFLRSIHGTSVNGSPLTSQCLVAPGKDKNQFGAPREKAEEARTHQFAQERRERISDGADEVSWCHDSMINGLQNRHEEQCQGETRGTSNKKCIGLTLKPRPYDLLDRAGEGRHGHTLRGSPRKTTETVGTTIRTITLPHNQTRK